MNNEAIIKKYTSTERRQSEHRMFGGYDFSYINLADAELMLEEYGRQLQATIDFNVKQNLNLIKNLASKEQVLDHSLLYRWVKASERKPENKGTYITRRPDTGGKDFVVDNRPFNPKYQDNFLDERAKYGIEWLEPYPDKETFIKSLTPYSRTGDGYCQCYFPVFYENDDKEKICPKCGKIVSEEKIKQHSKK